LGFRELTLNLNSVIILFRENIMNKIGSNFLIITILLSLFISMPTVLAANTAKDDIQEYVFVLQASDASNNPQGKPDKSGGIPTDDNSMTNPDYSRLRYYWKTSITYYINPTNSYGIADNSAFNLIADSADTWDAETSYQVFNTPIADNSLHAGVYDQKNVVSWGYYSQAGAIAVTYIWAKGTTIIETDCILNTNGFTWTTSAGVAGTENVQNIMTHEFGHWCGLKDLYSSKDYWLTMYGYAGYGETNKITLGLGDINGVRAVYGI
jgi:hypothetical protein